MGCLLLRAYQHQIQGALLKDQSPTADFSKMVMLWEKLANQAMDIAAPDEACYSQLQRFHWWMEWAVYAVTGHSAANPQTKSCWTPLMAADQTWESCIRRATALENRHACLRQMGKARLSIYRTAGTRENPGGADEVLTSWLHLWRELMTEEPGNADLHHLYSLVQTTSRFAHLCDYSGAHHHALRALELEPEDPMTWCALGWSHLRLRNAPEAARWFRRFSEEGAEQPERWRLPAAAGLAFAEDALGNLAAAQSARAQALQIAKEKPWLDEDEKVILSELRSTLGEGQVR